jgi:uncharacterized protein (DUF952 family)
VNFFHIVERSTYDEGHEPYVHPSLADEGFIHCSTAEQLPHTIERYFPPGSDLLVLEVDPDHLTADVRWEMATIGEEFPHVYGPIDRAAIVAVRPWG